MSYGICYIIEIGLAVGAAGRRNGVIALVKTRKAEL